MRVGGGEVGRCTQLRDLNLDADLVSSARQRSHVDMARALQHHEADAKHDLAAEPSGFNPTQANAALRWNQNVSSFYLDMLYFP